jgi:DNA-binding PadR family transcriptional regulator
MPPRPPTSSDLTAVTTLGLLAERPRHPYEIQRLIRERNKTFVKGLPRSLYHAIDRLLTAGLIAQGDTSREGRRPERTTYCITEHGREALETWLVELLSTPDFDEPNRYSAALSLVGYLTPEQAHAALRARLLALDLELTGATARMHGMRPILPRLFMLEEEQRLAGVEAEREFTATIAAELEAGTLRWDVEKLRKLAESGTEADWPALRAATGEAD